MEGFYQYWRKRVRFFLIFVFLFIPWLKINGHQAILLDLQHRKFAFLGLVLRAHNAPLLFFVLAALGFGLFFVTSIWGRIWCGWACPQTVFIEGVFRKIERWIDGNHLERKKLADADWSAVKVRKRATKWILYLSFSMLITHSFLAYFVGTEDLMDMVTSSPIHNWEVFLFMAVATSIVMFDFCWFREQFCIIACPYGRFQSVLMDSHSLAVVYDSGRGEPRVTPELKSSGTKAGDCINCYKCVQVCPTGIDIRRGVQMECIGCTNCIDICDEVMTKIKKPKGLIRYDSLAGLQKRPRKWVKTRSVAYAAIVVSSVCALVFLLARLAPVDVQILRAKESPYTVEQNIVINHFRVELSNRTDGPHEIDFRAPSGIELVTAMRPVQLEKEQVTRVDVFIKLPKNQLSNGQKKFDLEVIDHDPKNNETRSTVKDVTVVGPFS